MPLYDISGIATSSSSASASAQIRINVSGFVSGSGDLIDASLMKIAGVSIGSGDISGVLYREVGISGSIWGSGSLNTSIPEPIYGIAVVTAYMDIIHVPFPICELSTISTVFRWGHVFTVGDLELNLQDSCGNPFTPVSISYTLYQMQQGNTLKQIGPSGRIPVSSKVGNFYVTGTAGECGQPGLWVVRWSYQKTFSSSIIEEDCFFQVVDSVSCPIPGDNLARCCKYGWDDN